MSLELGKGILLEIQLGRLKDAGALRREQVSLGKLNSVREAIRIGMARECRTLLGANGVTLEYRLRAGLGQVAGCRGSVNEGRVDGPRERAAR